VRVLQAAILHDTVEDTHTTIGEVASAPFSTHAHPLRHSRLVHLLNRKITLLSQANLWQRS
jgi:hypothetical protein